MKKVLLLITFLASVITTNAQVKVGDATLPSKVSVANKDLTINGSGIRQKFVFDLYAAGLYLTEKSSNAEKIVAMDEPMQIKMDILSSLISTKKLLDAFKSGIEKGNPASEVTRLKPKTEQFLSFIKNEIKVGNVYDLIYEPGVGTKLLENGNLLGTIQGLDFKVLLFNIWLSKTPVDDDLKEGLLN